MRRRKCEQHRLYFGACFTRIEAPATAALTSGAHQKEKSGEAALKRFAAWRAGTPEELDAGSACVLSVVSNDGSSPSRGECTPVVTCDTRTFFGVAQQDTNTGE
jgi:hypothetical protein